MFTISPFDRISPLLLFSNKCGRVRNRTNGCKKFAEHNASIIDSVLGSKYIADLDLVLDEFLISY